MPDEGMQTFLGAPVPANRFWVIKLLYGFLAVFCALGLNRIGPNYEFSETEIMLISVVFVVLYELLGMKPTALVPMLNASCFKTPFTTTSTVMKLTNTCDVGGSQDCSNQPFTTTSTVMKLTNTCDVGGSQDCSNQVVVLGESNGVWGGQYMGWKKGILWFVYASMFGASFMLFYFSKDVSEWRKEFLFTGSMLFLSMYELIGFNPVAIAPMLQMLLNDTDAHWSIPPPT